MTDAFALASTWLGSGVPGAGLETMPWWVWMAIAVSALLIVAAGGAVALRNRRTPEPEDEQR